MAEGWARHLKSDKIEAYSAGIAKHNLNSMSIHVMAEKGVDISTHASKTIDELPIKHFDYVITLCSHANETCPIFPGGAKKLHIGFDDPPFLAKRAQTKEEALAIYRRVRDEIREFIEGLPDNLYLNS
jgi:arsenate reductase